MSSGIYIHIPFCSRKCDYCDFFSFKASSSYVDKYIDALLDEINSGKHQALSFDSIYIGGGTPSCIDASYINRILSRLYARYNLNSPEITIELNPETITCEKLQIYKESGVNRISLGVQSFASKNLEALGRHRMVDLNSLWPVIFSIFTNVSIDLMYGIPKQTLQNLREDLRSIPENIKHVSCYCLSIEPGTQLYKKSCNLNLPNDDLLLSMQETIINFLGIKDIYRYEISNYARPSFESRHNLHYWQYDNYLGFGAGAVSTISGERMENTKSMLKYLSRNYVESAYSLSENEQINEYVMLALRLIKGLDLSAFQRRFSKEKVNELLQRISDNNKFFYLKDNFAALNSQGLNLSNTIVSNLFL